MDPGNPDLRQGVEIFTLNGFRFTPALDPALKWPQIGLADTVNLRTAYVFVGLSIASCGQILSLGSNGYLGAAFVLLNKTAPVLNVSPSMQCLSSQVEPEDHAARFARANWVGLRQHGVRIPAGSSISLYMNAGEVGRNWCTVNLFMLPPS